jgi:hypothetical protein
MSISWQTISVFISSTFDDMNGERDYLVKRVFPELREWCEKRKLRLVDIDLRWGVTEEDATQNKNTLKICLHQIDKSRPFFLNFLGQRRGWVPEKKDISSDTCLKCPALKDYIGNSSITELEILHAIINPLTHKERAKHAFFYIRDGSYVDHLPHDPPLLRKIYTNHGILDPVKRKAADDQLQEWRETETRKGRLIHKKTDCPTHAYSAKWDASASTPELLVPLRHPSTRQCPSLFTQYSNKCPKDCNQKWWCSRWVEEAGVEISYPNLTVKEETGQQKAQEFNRKLTKGRLTDFTSDEKELSDVIIRDLKKAIKDEFPERFQDEENIPEESDLQKELDQQEQFLQLNSEGFIDRKEYFKQIDTYSAEKTERLFVLTAAGGLGKTMLLANWINHFRKENTGEKTPVFYRFIGASDRSTSPDSLLRYLLREMKETAGLFNNEIPDNPEELRKVWPELLEKIGKLQKTIIVIDGINQLESGLSDLNWIPQPVPYGIKLVISFKKEGNEAKNLYRIYKENSSVTLVEMQPFSKPDDREQLIKKYLERYIKQLDDYQIKKIINFPGADNPLFLKAILSELRVFGAFVNLTDKITRAEFGATPDTAFDAVLNRLENDPAYSPVAPKIAVPLLFGLLSHARHGLSEEELVGIFLQELKWKDTEDARVALKDSIRLILRQVRPFLARRDGRHDFFYESFRIAALQRYRTDSDPYQYPKKLGHEWHQALTDYFNRLACPNNQREWNKAPIRAISELPYQINRINSDNSTEKLFCDLTFIEASISNDLLDQFLGDLDFASQRNLLDVLTVRDSLHTSIAAIRQRPNIALQTMINRIRNNQNLGKFLKTSIRHAETALDTRGLWLCSLTRFNTNRLIKNVIAFSSLRKVFYVLSNENAIECHDLYTQRLIERQTPFHESVPLHVLIHPIIGKTVWIDRNGSVYEGNNVTDVSLRTNDSPFSFFGSGIVGIDPKNNLIFFEPGTHSVKILIPSLTSQVFKIFTNTACSAGIFIAGDRLPSQRIYLLKIQENNITVDEWPPIDSPVTSACLDEEFSTVVFTTRGRRVLIFDRINRKLLQTSSFRLIQNRVIRGIVHYCKAVSYNDHSYVILATNEGELIVWDRSLDLLHQRGYYFSITQGGILHILDTLPDEGKIVVASDIQLQLLDLEGTDEFTDEFAVPTPVTQCSMSPDGWLILANKDRKSITWIHNNKRTEKSIGNYEPTSVAAGISNGEGFVGYSRGSVLRLQPDKEPEEEDGVDLFDHAVVSVVSLDNKRVLAASKKGEFKIVQFQPVKVLPQKKPVGYAREEMFVRRLGNSDDFVSCGRYNIGNCLFSVVVVRSNDSHEIVLETPDSVRDIATKVDGLAIFIVLNDRVVRYTKTYSGWKPDTWRFADVTHVITCNNDFLGVVLQEKGLIWLELWSLSGDRMETAIAMELPYQCESICSSEKTIAVGSNDGRHCIINIRK